MELIVIAKALSSSVSATILAIKLSKMTEKPDSLDDLSPDQLAALVELAENYQSGRLTRRDVIKSAGVGGLAGLLGSAGWTATTDSSGSRGNGQTASDGSENEPTISLVTEGSDVGSIVAAPGSVQTAIDSAASNGGGKVVLDPTKRYDQPSSAWKLKDDVILDFNGAILYGTGNLPDTDIIHVFPGSQVHSPRINLYNGGDGYSSSNGYRGRVFSLDTKWGSYFARGATIQNGLIIAAGGTGTACYLGVTQNRTFITHLSLNFDVGIPRDSSANSAIDTGVHMDTTEAGSDGWINGVHIGGHWRYVNTGVLQEGANGQRANQQNFNLFQVQLQAPKDANAFWQIKDPTWARLNRWWGMIWDMRRYSGEAWKIDSQYQSPEDEWRGCKLNSVLTPTPSLTEPENVRNRSPNTHYVNSTFDFSTTEF